MTDNFTIMITAAFNIFHLLSLQYRNFKLIYRRYAGLYFTFGVDVTDNELLLMETVHLFVELLDEYFSNVCEVRGLQTFWIHRDWESLIAEFLRYYNFFLFQLDIVFHFNKVYALLDEFILAGEVQETNKKTIIGRIKELEKLE